MSMNKIVKISSISIGLLMANLSYANPLNSDNEMEINFSDPTSVYSAADVNLGTDGAALGLTLAGEVSKDWAFLGKAEIRESGDMFRIRAASTSNTLGSGFLIDYIKHNDFHKDIEDSKSETLVLNAMQVLPFNDGKTMLVPLVGVGYTKNDFAIGRTNIWMAQAMIIHNWTDNIWTNVMPTYTRSFSDMKMNDGLNKQRIDSFGAEMVTGYRFKGNQNVRLHLKFNDEDDNQAWAAYTYAF